ncbi:MAG: hypothetical protein SOS24_04775 [Clostridia bacterium]|nr:hypothetical protein [Clostridia bacterium]
MARRTKKPGAELAQQIIAQYKPQTVEEVKKIYSDFGLMIRKASIHGCRFLMN